MSESRRMEGEIMTWILEFLLVKPAVPDRLVKQLLADEGIPVSADNPRLKKAMVLRSIEAEVEIGSVPERLLDWMELVEELDVKEGVKATDAMKEAYCAVAVECTAKYLCFEGVGRRGGGGKYLEALEKVWRGRIRNLEEGKRSELVSEELKTWRDMLEEALWDSAARERLVERNTRNEALKFVGEFLREAMNLMGPSFLEISARNFRKRRRKKENMELEPNAGEGSSKLPDMSPELVVVDTPPSKENHSKSVKHTQKHVAPRKRLRGPVRIENSEALEMQVSSSNNDTLPAHNKDPIQEEHNVGVSSSKYDTLSSPEVNKVQEALKASVMELKAALKDPLPDPLRMAGTLFANLARTILNQEVLLENQSGGLDVTNSHVDGATVDVPKRSMNREPSVEKQMGEDVNMANPAANENMKSAQTNGGNHAIPSCSYQNDGVEMASKDANHECSGDVDAANPSANQAVPSQDNGDNAGNPSCSNNGATLKPNLMERNPTAHTLEWNDSIDDLPEDTTKHKRIRLDTPRRHAISPLKKYEMTKITRRRKIRRWSVEEEEALREGVQKFGKGNWKLILNFKRDIFVERTEVDLKDKWRNLTK